MALVVRNPRARQRALQTEEAREEYDVHRPLLELRITPATGLGLVATQYIKRGTRILAETPLVVVSGMTVFSLIDLQAKLSPEQAEQLFGLHLNKALLDGRSPHRIRNAIVAQSSALPTKERLEQLVEVEVLRWGIIVTNTLPISYNRTPADFRAVYPLASRLNHSCTPNAYAAYNPTLGLHTVHTIRDIHSNEELTIAYNNPAQPREVRSHHLEHNFAFDCACHLCTANPVTTAAQRSEDVRVRLGLVFRALEVYDDQPGEKIPRRLPVARNPSEAFALADECIDLLREEGLRDMLLARACRYKSRFALQLGLLTTARECAELEAEVEVVCLGQETGWLNEVVEKGHGAGDMGGNAEAWASQIEVVAEKEMVKLRMCAKRRVKEIKKAEKKAAKKAGKGRKG